MVIKVMDTKVIYKWPKGKMPSDRLRQFVAEYEQQRWTEALRKSLEHNTLISKDLEW